MPVHLIHCAHCRGTIDDGSSFCPHCGEAVSYAVPNNDPFVGRMVSQHYRVIERIARGGMGEVYLARHAELNQRVAVKFLHRRFADDEEFATRFFNEARSACRVNHPNAVSIYDFGRLDDGTLYIVMEFVEGISLKQMIQRDGRLSLKSTLRIGQQAADVLSTAHRQSIVHRDVKPDNIMVLESPSGRVSIKMLDFGIAKILDDDSSIASMTQTGTAFGTPEYMSPEQAAGRQVDERSDVYSLCVCIFTMLTGNPPFRGKNKLALLQRHIREPAPSLSRATTDTMPTALTALVASGLEKDAGKRPQSMDALAQELELIEGVVLSATHSQMRPVAAPSAAPQVDSEYVLDETDVGRAAGALPPLDAEPDYDAGFDMTLGPMHEPDALGTGDVAPQGRVLTHGGGGKDPSFKLGGPAPTPATDGYRLGAGRAVDDDDGYSLGGAAPAGGYTFGDDLNDDPYAAPLAYAGDSGGGNKVIVTVAVLVALALGLGLITRMTRGPSPDDPEVVAEGSADNAVPSETVVSDSDGSGVAEGSGNGVANIEPAPAEPPVAPAAPSAPDEADTVDERLAEATTALGEGDRAQARAILRTLRLEGHGDHAGVAEAAERLETMDSLINQIEAELGAGNCGRADERVIRLRESYSHSLAVTYYGRLSACTAAAQPAPARPANPTPRPPAEPAPSNPGPPRNLDDGDSPAPTPAPPTPEPSNPTPSSPPNLPSSL